MNMLVMQKKKEFGRVDNLKKLKHTCFNSMFDSNNLFERNTPFIISFRIKKSPLSTTHFVLLKFWILKAFQSYLILPF